MLLDGAFGSLVVNGDPNFYKNNTNLSVFLFKHLNKDKAIHESYAIAGSDILSAHTFSIHPKVPAYKVMLKALVASAREVADRYDKKVALSVGPIQEGTIEDYSKVIEPVAQEVDYILLETFTSLSELEIAVTSALMFDRPIISQMCFGKYFSIAGDSLYDYVEEIEPLVDYIGFNCVSPYDLDELIPQMVELVDSDKICVQPNVGEPTINETSIYYEPLDHNKLASLLKKYNIGMVGLCCGSTPVDIQMLKVLL